VDARLDNVISLDERRRLFDELVAATRWLEDADAPLAPERPLAGPTRAVGRVARRRPPGARRPGFAWAVAGPPDAAA